jgi:hypothetical protein
MSFGVAFAHLGLASLFSFNDSFCVLSTMRRGDAHFAARAEPFAKGRHPISRCHWLDPTKCVRLSIEYIGMTLLTLAANEWQLLSSLQLNISILGLWSYSKYWSSVNVLDAFHSYILSFLTILLLSGLSSHFISLSWLCDVFCLPDTRASLRPAAFLGTPLHFRERTIERRPLVLRRAEQVHARDARGGGGALLRSSHVLFPWYLLIGNGAQLSIIAPTLSYLISSWSLQTHFDTFFWATTLPDRFRCIWLRSAASRCIIVCPRFAVAEGTEWPLEGSSPFTARWALPIGDGWHSTVVCHWTIT